MTLFTLRAADEVRTPQLVTTPAIKLRTERFDPSTHRDRYQEACER
jgi:hypothetical protein